jgi:hypothetical protein
MGATKRSSQVRPSAHAYLHHRRTGLPVSGLRGSATPSSRSSKTPGPTSAPPPRITPCSGSGSRGRAGVARRGFPPALHTAQAVKIHAGQPPRSGPVITIVGREGPVDRSASDIPRRSSTSSARRNLYERGSGACLPAAELRRGGGVAFGPGQLVARRRGTRLVVAFHVGGDCIPSSTQHADQRRSCPSGRARVGVRWARAR